MRQRTNLLKGFPAEERLKYEYELMMNCGICPNNILEEAYSHIKKCLLTENTNFPEVKKSNKMANRLHRKNCLSFRDIHQHVTIKFIEHNKDKKFNPELGSLFTYTAYHTYLEVRDLNRRHEKDREKEAAFHYCVLDDKLNPHWHSDSLPDFVYKKSWKPLLKSQCPLLDGLIEYDSPEDILIKKEFWRLALSHYDEIDIMVLLGRMKRTEAAAELNMNYDAYCKSLQRKNESFRIIATKAGYC